MKMSVPTKMMFTVIVTVVVVLLAVKGLCSIDSGRPWAWTRLYLPATGEVEAIQNAILTLPEVVEGVIDGVVHIQCSDWQGTGFVIGPRLIKTARHTIKGQTDFTITTKDGHVIKATRAISHKGHDTGYIYIDDLTCDAAHEVELHVLELGNFSDCKFGEDVFVIGGSLGEQFFPNLTSGIISNLNLDLESYGILGNYGWSVMWMTDAATYSGNSGSPVFNMDGEVVGILVGGYQDFESLSYCIPVDVFTEDIEAVMLMFVQDKYQVEKPADIRVSEMQWQISSLQQQLTYLQQDTTNLLDMYDWFLENRADLDRIKEVVREVVDLVLVELEDAEPEMTITLAPAYSD